MVDFYVVIRWANIGGSVGIFSFAGDGSSLQLKCVFFELIANRNPYKTSKIV